MGVAIAIVGCALWPRIAAVHMKVVATLTLTQCMVRNETKEATCEEAGSSV